MIFLLAIVAAVALARGQTWHVRSHSLTTSPLDETLFMHKRMNKTPFFHRRDWAITQPGTSGVSAMQLVVVSSTQVLILDKVQRNPMSIDGHPAWSSIYDLNSDSAHPVNLTTNSFCAGGAFLSNGTLVSIGGYAPALTDNAPDTNGLQAIRLFNPTDCSELASVCSFYENPSRIRLTSTRWYPTVVKLQDGSLLIMGGSKAGTFMNNPSLNNPTMEFYPPKTIHGFNGTQFPSPFLNNTLNANLFVISFLLPDGGIFIASNTKAIVYDWRNNIETPLPDIPNGVRVSYPMAGTGILLPLRPSNNYAPTVMLCGGSTTSDTTQPSRLSATDPASAQCASITLTRSGISSGWIVETMPEGRIMPDAVILPTGQVLILNGGKTGYSGYGNVLHQVGSSNADNPALQPVLYDPSLPLSSRFSHAGLPTSPIARLYHSTASLTPLGDIIIAGSSPNEDVSTVKYATEYRVERLIPPYVSMIRPSFTGLPSNILYAKAYKLELDRPYLGAEISVVLQDFGFSTHALHMNMRFVELVSSSLFSSVSMTGPPNATIFPPGPAWIFVVVNNVPSMGQSVIVGDGSDPPVNVGAIRNMLFQTSKPR